MRNFATYKGQTAQELFDAGYRQVSRKYGTLARLDITEEEMIAFFIKRNFGDKNSSIPSCPIESQKDHYRRVHTKDLIEGTPEKILAQVRKLSEKEIYV